MRGIPRSLTAWRYAAPGWGAVVTEPAVGGVGVVDEEDGVDEFCDVVMAALLVVFEGGERGWFGEGGCGFRRCVLLGPFGKALGGVC